MSQQQFDIDDFVYIDKDTCQLGKIISLLSKEAQVQILTPFNKLQVNVESPFFREIVLSSSTKKVKVQNLEKLNVFKIVDFLKEFYDFQNQTIDQDKVIEQDAYLLRFFLRGKKKLLSIDPDSNICFFCNQSQKQGDIHKCECGKLYHLSCYKKNTKCFDCDQNLYVDLKKNQTSNEFDFSGLDQLKNIKLQQYNNTKQKQLRVDSQQEILKQKNNQNKDIKELEVYYQQFKKKYKQRNINQCYMIRNKIRNQFYKIFLKYAYQNQKSNEDLGTFNKLSLPDLAPKIEKLALNIDRILFEKFDQVVSKTSPYSLHSKQLIYSLRHHNQKIIQKILSGKMSLKELCDLNKTQLMDQNLLEKIEREKNEYWTSRKIEDEDIAKPLNIKESGDKNANKEIVPVGIESEVKNNQQDKSSYLDQSKSQNTIEKIDSFRINNNQDQIDDLKDFKEKLCLKMKEFFSQDQYNSLKSKIDEIYNIVG